VFLPLSAGLVRPQVAALSAEQEREESDLAAGPRIIN